MTENEEKARDAQISSCVKSIFLGSIIEQSIYPFPKVNPDEGETLQLILDTLDKFMGAESENFREYDLKGAFPESYMDTLKEIGLFGLIIPEEYGGIGLSNLAYSRVFQQTSSYDAATSVTIGAHSSIGMKGLLLFGSDEQKQKYLPDLATGKTLAAFCLTEPGSGSDAASIQTKAEKQADGSWVLNGSKLWISNGGLADFFTVFARTEGEEGRLSAFIVERAFEGVTNGPKEDKMGIRASNTTTVEFQNVKVPAQNLLGEEGKGFKIAMSILNNGRTGLGGGCVGGIKACIAHSTKQAKERKQFGRPISDFLLIKDKIAQMTIDCFVAESVVSAVAHLMDSGIEDYSMEAAISKVLASESMWNAGNEALQIAAGNGFMKEFPYERMVRDSRINLIFEGTNEILRLYIGLSGMKEAGEYYKELSKGLGNIFNDPIKGFGVLSNYAGKQFSYVTAFGRDRLSFVPTCLREEAEVFENYVSKFSKQVEWILKKYGKEIVGTQLVTKRVADIAIDLFSGQCVLSRVSTMIENSSEAECSDAILLAKLFTQQAKRRMNQSLRRIEINEDPQIVDLANSILEKEKYPWDIF